MAKRPLFKKKSGVTAPSLSLKKGESEAVGVKRLVADEWNPDKVPYHLVDGKNGNTRELHAGKGKAECILCLRRSKNTKTKISPKLKTKAKAKKEVKKPVKKTKKTSK